jgi:hypothetical protein
MVCATEYYYYNISVYLYTIFETLLSLLLDVYLGVDLLGHMVGDLYYAENGETLLKEMKDR